MTRPPIPQSPLAGCRFFRPCRNRCANNLAKAFSWHVIWYVPLQQIVLADLGDGRSYAAWHNP
jgi:hypothetical protein